MPPAARVGDMHTCPMMNPGVPPIPHVGGPILPPGCPTVLIGGQPAARVGDMATCVGPPDTIAMGSTTVLIGNMPAARMGDQMAHGGAIVLGCPTVMIGDSGAGGGGGGGGARTAGSGVSGAASASLREASAIALAQLASRLTNPLALLRGLGSLESAAANDPDLQGIVKYVQENKVGTVDTFVIEPILNIALKLGSGASVALGGITGGVVPMLDAYLDKKDSAHIAAAGITGTAVGLGGAALVAAAAAATGVGLPVAAAIGVGIGVSLAWDYLDNNYHITDKLGDWLDKEGVGKDLDAAGQAVGGAGKAVVSGAAQVVGDIGKEIGGAAGGVAHFFGV